MNTLIMNSENYTEEIRKSNLLKDEQVLLKELISCFLNKETPPQIKKDAFERFEAKLPKLILNGEPVVVKHINVDVHRICINWVNSSERPFPFVKKRKSRYFQITRRRRRSAHNYF